MGCQTYSENLTALIDEELSTADEQGLRDHLVSCELCRAEHDSLLYATQATEALLQDRLEAPSWVLIRDRISTPAPRWGNFRWLFQPRWAGAVAALVLLLFSIPFYWSVTQPRAVLKEQLVVYIQERDQLEAIHRGIMDSEPVGWVTHNPFRTVQRLSENPFSLE